MLKQIYVIFEEKYVFHRQNNAFNRIFMYILIFLLIKNWSEVLKTLQFSLILAEQ